jgi:hypothetical protein
MVGGGVGVRVSPPFTRRARLTLIWKPALPPARVHRLVRARFLALTETHRHGDKFIAWSSQIA